MKHWFLNLRVSLWGKVWKLCCIFLSTRTLVNLNGCRWSQLNVHVGRYNIPTFRFHIVYILFIVSRDFYYINSFHSAIKFLSWELLWPVWVWMGDLFKWSALLFETWISQSSCKSMEKSLKALLHLVAKKNIIEFKRLQMVTVKCSRR